jgi:uncharacterized protein YpmB
MRDKILFGFIAFLVIVIVVLGIQTYFLKRKVDAVLEEQINKLALLKEQNLKKADSLEFLRKSLKVTIDKKQQSLYFDIASAKEKDIYYEDIKKSISTTDAADSLASRLTKRYIKR